jgi:hypothetical protein
MNQAAEFPIVIRCVGGGTRLTEYGCWLITQYRALESQRQAANVHSSCDDDDNGPPLPNNAGVNLVACGTLLFTVLSIGYAYFSYKEKAFEQMQRQMERQIPMEAPRGSRQ